MFWVAKKRPPMTKSAQRLQQEGPWTVMQGVTCFSKSLFEHEAGLGSDLE